MMEHKECYVCGLENAKYQVDHVVVCGHCMNLVHAHLLKMKVKHEKHRG